MTNSSIHEITVFFSYSHQDEEWLEKLRPHLASLKRQGLIKTWSDRDISAGSEWAKAIDQNLESADIILLLVSANFLASDYCWDIELNRAIARHEAGEACVIPIILKPVDWSGAPFGKLQALPKNAKPITRWDDPDEALLDVAQGIRKVVERMIATGEESGGAIAQQSKRNLPRIPQVWLHGWARYQPRNTADDPPEVADIQLDWTQHYQKEPSWKIPDVSTWEQTLAPELKALRRQIDQSFSAQTIEFRSTLPLSPILAVGYTFPESGHYVLRIKQGPNIWQTSATPTAARFKVVQEEGREGPNLLVGLAITGEGWKDIERFRQAAAYSFDAVVYAELASGVGSRAIASEGDAVALAIHAKDLLRKYKQTYAASCIHLVLFAPGGFALFLGHWLSRLGDLAAYEWDGQRYQPAVRLQAV